MSRRHKENEIKENYKPQQMESHTDGHLRDTSNQDSASKKLFSGLTFTKRLTFSSTVVIEKIVSGVMKAFSNHEFELDDKWIKIPRSAFDELGDGWLLNYRKMKESKSEESPKKKAGRNPIKSLFKKVADNKVMEFFHDTLCEVKKKCMELYENITQYSICFLHGIHKAFSPGEDPYGKISHYHDMIKQDIWDFPDRKTLNNYNNWFVNWKPVLFNESPKEKNERYRHSIWQQLIEWIYYYLQNKAPEYAVQLQRG